MRRICVLLHRYVGLAIAVFLVVAGLTGSLLVFQHELDALLNPALFNIVPPSPAAPPLDRFTLRDRVADHLPGVQIFDVPLSPIEPGHTLSFYGRTDDPTHDDEFFVDPYTGQIVGSRLWGDLSQGWKNVMPFAYRLHYTLALGEVGMFLFGVVALLWTVDCFVGAYLTFPPAANSATGWGRRWLQAWLFKVGGFFKTTFTLHQASGLWLWAFLLIFAWSAVALNLPSVYEPVMQATFGMDRTAWELLPARDRPLESPRLDWRTAYARGKELMAAEAARQKFTIGEELRLRYSPEKGVYEYRVNSSLDLSSEWSRTLLYFDGDTGERRGFEGMANRPLGTTITAWLFALHFALVGGMPYRMLVSSIGILIAVLSVTGVIIWRQKWMSRRKQAQFKQLRAKAAADAMPT